MRKVFFDSLGEEWPLEGVRRARNKHKNVEQSEANGDASRANTGDTHCVGERADQMNDERQRAENEELEVHEACLCAA